MSIFSLHEELFGIMMISRIQGYREVLMGIKPREIDGWGEWKNAIKTEIYGL